MFKKFEIRPIVLKADGGVEFCQLYAEAQALAGHNKKIAFGLFGEEPNGPERPYRQYRRIADVSSKQAMLDLVKNLLGVELDWPDQDRIEFTRVRDLAAMEIIGDLLRVLHPGAVGLIHNEHGDDRGKAACEAVTAGKAYLGRGSAVEVLSGYFGYEGTELRADFQVPVGATTAEKDAAFMAALAQQADIDYLAIGESRQPLPESETPDSLEAKYGSEHPEWLRADWQQDVANGDTKLGYWDWVLHNIESHEEEQDSDPDRLDRIRGEQNARRSIFTEAMEAKFISTSVSPLEEIRFRRDIVAQEVLGQYPRDTVISREIYDADDLFGECLIWMNSHFEFPNWEGRTVDDFFSMHGIPGEPACLNVIQYAANRANKDGVLAENITLQELWDAQTLGENGWLLPSGVEVRFHQTGAPA
jgi:hypothetical protein